MAEPTNTDWLGSLKGKVAEANALARADKARRANAANATGSVIMNTNDLETGQWDAHKVLKTTIGGSEWGEQRDITPADIVRFKQKITQLQTKYKGGILAEQVIDLSRKIDRERARDEIKNAVVASALNGELRFIANASGKTKGVVRHHVRVEFNKELFNALAAGGNTDAKQAALKLRKSRLLFECSCGRHTYWYRYLATIGKYGCGRAEVGFPKVRNPELKGVACKHVIRVMSEIMSSASVLAMLTEMMKRAKAHEFNKSQVRTSQAEAEKQLAEQNRRKKDRIDDQNDKAKTKRAKQRLKTLKANQAKKANKAFEKVTPPAKKVRQLTQKQFDAWAYGERMMATTPEEKAAVEIRISAKLQQRQQGG
jgi:hypothetical protein